MLCNPIVLNSLASARRTLPNHDAAVRYRGFLLLPQANYCWLVRPERSPMSFLPFRTPNCSLEEVKQIIDLRLSNEKTLDQAA